ncbi:lipid A deacylase LpxR family protein [Echinicola sp. 20G]|uniref:lipid A deacylase LpxR family protein n=1 Tax=Echinicola sp. 20G TaxID=2781961 RepID=UPI00351C1937
MSKPNKILFSLCFLVFEVIYCQAQSDEGALRKHEMFLQVDNDALAFTHFDRYYTHGVFLGYARYLTPRSRMKFDLSQQIYTPQRYTQTDVREYDRPYAGILFLNTSYQYLVKRGWLKGNFLLGKVGPGSKAEDVQVWYHRLFGFPQPQGWRYQIGSGALINVRTDAAYQMIDAGPFDFWLSSKFALGNFDRSIRFSPSFRLGKFNRSGQSYITGSRVGQSGGKEIYFHGGVEFKRVFWNATIQGVGERADWGVFRMVPEKMVNEYFGELVLAYPKFGFSYRFFYRSKETEAAKGQLLGSLRFSYIF